MSRPFRKPSLQPTDHPSYSPICQPSNQPTSQPSNQPFKLPTEQPSYQPEFHPAAKPTFIPSNLPTSQPLYHPTSPSNLPTSKPGIIYVDILKFSLASMGNAFNSLSIILDSIPLIFIEIKISFEANVSQISLPVAYPDSIVVSNSSDNYQYFVAIITTIPSQYRVRLQLNGPSSYRIKYPTVNIITVFNYNQPPPVPTVKSALYSGDATYILFNFDSETNKGGFMNLFPCNNFFNFTGVSKSTCQWIDASTINIYPSPSYAFPSKLHVLMSNNIMAICSNNQTDSKLWKSVSPITVAVTLPTNPLFPTVVISAPQYLGKCSPLIFDLSNSFGSARRPWKRVHFDILKGGVSDNSSELYLLLNGDKFSISPPTSISYSLFDGKLYNITVTLCDF